MCKLITAYGNKNQIEISWLHLAIDDPIMGLPNLDNLGVMKIDWPSVLVMSFPLEKEEAEHLIGLAFRDVKRPKMSHAGIITSFFAKKREATNKDKGHRNDVQNYDESDKKVGSSDDESDQTSWPVDTAETLESWRTSGKSAGICRNLQEKKTIGSKKIP